MNNNGNNNNAMFNNYIDLYREQISCMRELFSVQRLLIRGIQDTGEIVNRIIGLDANQNTNQNIRQNNNHTRTNQTSSNFAFYTPTSSNLNFNRTPPFYIPPPTILPPPTMPPPPPSHPPPGIPPPTSNTPPFSWNINNNRNRRNPFLRRQNSNSRPQTYSRFPLRNRRRFNTDPSHNRIYNTRMRNRDRRRRRGGLIFSNIDLSRNNFSFRFNNNLMTILNNSLYDFQPRETLTREQYETLIETDNWTNLSTRYNAPLDTICPITQESLGNDTHQEAIRINSCGHFFSNSLREWFNFSSLCPVCRHNLFDDLSGNEQENNDSQNNNEEDVEEPQEENNDIEEPNQDIPDSPSEPHEPTENPRDNPFSTIQPNTIVFDFGLSNDANSNDFTEQLTNTLMRGINSLVSDNSANIINFINDISNNQQTQNILEFEANLFNQDEENSFWNNETNINNYNNFINDLSNNFTNTFINDHPFR